MLGGALGFALLHHAADVMVGASGALFGLAGALTLWDAQDQQRPAARLAARLGLIMTGLILLNLVTWWIQGGNLAWQAHLGGFIAGFLVAVILDLYPRLLAKIRS